MSGAHGLGLSPAIESNIGECLADPSCQAAQLFFDRGNPDRFSDYPVDVIETIQSCEEPCALAAKCVQFVIEKGSE
jgi:hypothetical protein